MQGKTLEMEQKVTIKAISTETIDAAIVNLVSLDGTESSYSMTSVKDGVTWSLVAKILNSKILILTAIIV